MIQIILYIKKKAFNLHLKNTKQSKIKLYEKKSKRKRQKKKKAKTA